MFNNFYFQWENLNINKTQLSKIQMNEWQTVRMKFKSNAKNTTVILPI